jgi:hypothetical protein
MAGSESNPALDVVNLNVRRANELCDVAKAISVAAKLMAQKLDEMERDLLVLHDLVHDGAKP